MAFRNDQAVFARNAAETISLKSADGTQAWSLTNAVHYDLSAKEAAASNRTYLAGNAVWTIPEGTYTVAPGWTITDSSGQVNTAITVVHSEFAAFWKIDTLNLSIAASLYDSVAVQTRTNTQDTASGRSPSWADVSGQTAVRCRVQPRETDPYDGRGIRSTKRVYDVYFATPITSVNSAGDFARLHWGSVYLTITKYDQAERIDQLCHAECEATP